MNYCSAKFKKYLIVNADDFGLSHLINEGICTAFRKGIVTSVSLMSNGAAFPHARDFVRQNPQMDVGWHVNLTTGRPVLNDKKSSLVDHEGCFFRKKDFIKRAITGRIDRADAEYEIRAQLALLKKSDIQISHIDSHHDIHCLPFVAHILAPVLQENNFLNVRYVGSRLMSRLISANPVILIENAILRIAAHRLVYDYSRRGTDYVCGFNLVKAKDKGKAIKFNILNCKNGFSELICHPGEYDKNLTKLSYVKGRQLEREALCSDELPILIRENEIILTSFADIESRIQSHLIN